MFSKWWHYPLAFFLALGIAGAGLAGLAAALIYPNLPPLEALRDYKPKLPLRVYTADGALIGEFGEQRRTFVPINKVPLLMKQAIIAAEDERFYEHGGIDVLGIFRAALANLVSGGKREGASTLTMQVARNFYLSSEKTYTRKLSEALLAIKINHELSKDKVLELYINQIYLGQRAYGFEAAARTYFGKPLSKLDLAEFAMLAGLPKGPSIYNPIASMTRAKTRQEYVLGRMLVLKFITPAQYQQAMKEKIVVRHNHPWVDVWANYAAEMVRQALYDQYGDTIYTTGYRAYTTLVKNQQEAADQALWKGVMAYDQRHGYSGPEKHLNLPEDADARLKAAKDALGDLYPVHDLIPAVVIAEHGKTLEAYTDAGKTVELPPAAQKFVATWYRKPPAERRLKVGDVIRLVKTGNTWEVSELPSVEAAFVALNPKNGAITALVGGFSYDLNQYNHVTQAYRQPGSSFKPFIYSAALEKGFTPATLIANSPFTIPADQAGGVEWQPKNYEDNFTGPVSMRYALANSINLVSIRILQAIGIGYARDYIKRFGLDPANQPPYLTMALGAGTVTPLQMAQGYAVFANGGYAVEPYLLDRVYNGQGQLVMQARPRVAGVNAPRVLDPRNAFLMTSMMESTTRSGTAAAAASLGRVDIAGKTGTTNDMKDAWFCGFDPYVVGIAWMGYDQPKTLGRGEVGARAALPIWMSFMAKVLPKYPNQPWPVPPGIVSEPIDPTTGQSVAPGTPGARTEYFYQEDAPTPVAPNAPPGGSSPWGPPAGDIPTAPVTPAQPSQGTVAPL